jgi:hypothetical protein
MLKLLTRVRDWASQASRSFLQLACWFSQCCVCEPFHQQKRWVNWCWISSIHGAILGGHDCGDRNMNLSCSGSGWFSKLGYPNFIIKNWYRFGMLGSSIFRNPPEVLHNFDPLSFPDHLP